MNEFKLDLTVTITFFYEYLMNNEFDLDKVFAILQDKHVNLKHDSIHIKEQLEEAIGDYNSRSIMAPTEWFIKAKAAKRYNAINMQKCQDMIGILKRVAHKKNNDSLESRFMMFAKKMLKQNVFDDILRTSTLLKDES
jgi:UTP-glucose-1-phosphate uridylyltransferase